MDEVFLLWHVHQVDGEDDEKLNGVYQQEGDAKAAIKRLHNKPRFRHVPRWISNLSV